MVKLKVITPQGAYIPGKGGRVKGDFYDMPLEEAKKYAASNPEMFLIEEAEPPTVSKKLSPKDGPKEQD